MSCKASNKRPWPKGGRWADRRAGVRRQEPRGQKPRCDGDLLLVISYQLLARAVCVSQ